MSETHPARFSYGIMQLTCDTQVPLLMSQRKKIGAASTVTGCPFKR